MKVRYKPNMLLYFLIAITMISCSSRSNYCELPEINQAVKDVLILNMNDWEDNANYSGIKNFEEKVNQVIKDIKVVNNWYKEDNDSKILSVYLTENDKGVSSCICSSKIQFLNHEEYKKSIEEPVNKVKTEEHPLNSAYLRLKAQMNYLDNDGFVFSYVVVSKENQPIRVIKFYPYTREPYVDDAGGLIFNYVKKMKKGSGSGV